MADIDLSAPEVQAAIKAAVDEATSGLLKKRDELLGEVKKLRKNSEIDPEDYQRLKDENEELQGKVTEAQKATKKAADDAQKALKQAETESSAVRQLLVENGLNEALTKAGVKPEYLKAAKAMFAKDVQVIADGENRVAKVGDKALTDFVSEWAQSDEGKHFVTAPANSGGGASSGKGGNLTPSKKASEMNPAEKAAFIKEHGIDKWSAKVGADYAG